VLDQTKLASFRLQTFVEDHDIKLTIQNQMSHLYHLTEKCDINIEMPMLQSKTRGFGDQQEWNFQHH